MPQIELLPIMNMSLQTICSKIVLLLLLLGIGLQNRASAQSCRLFATEDDLPNTLVNDVIEDADNMIWVATEYGLCRYDGSKFTTYLHEDGNPNSLRNNYVRTLYVDAHGRLLIGSRSGLQVYRPDTDDFSALAVFEENGMSGGDINKIIERKNGEIWASGNTPCCIEFLHDETPVLRANAFTNKVNFTECIVEDSEGRIWVDRRMSELYCLEVSGSITHFRQNGKDVPFLSFHMGLDGMMYAGGQEKGLYRMNPETNQFEQLLGPEDDYVLVRDICNLDGDNLLLATDNAGLKVYNYRTGQCSTYQLDEDLMDPSSQKVHAICKDQNQILWLALYQKGVLMAPPRPQPFHYLGSHSPIRNSIGDKCVTSIFQDSKGRNWVATDNGGLYAIDADGQQILHFPYTGRPNTVPSSLVKIFEDSKHRFWYGSYSQGFGWIDPSTGRCKQLTIQGRDAGSVSVYDYAEDNDGRIWAISMGFGLLCYDEAKETMFTPQDYDSCRWGGCMYFDKLRSKLMIGSYNGLTAVDLFGNTIQFQQYLGQSIVFAMASYTSGRLALCTTEGLVIFDMNTGEYVSYTVNDGLPSDLVYSARCDAEGLLWISTNAGLSCFNEKRHSFTNYSVHDGLQNKEFYKNASMMDSQGRLWFGGTSGITYFDPLELNHEGEKCQARIVDVTAGGRKVKDRKNHYFDENSFTIEMATLPLYRTQHAIYSYSLDDDPWIDLHPGQNQISFSHVQPGKHVFQYKAKVSGIESECKSYTFYVSYPWYRQWWMHLLVTLFVCLVGYMIYLQLVHRHIVRKRLAQHIQNQAINEAKLQFFMNIAHEIRTPMTMIVSPLQKLLAADSDPDRQRAYLVMQRNAYRVVGTINQLMDLRKIDKKQMKLYYSQVDIANDIKEVCESMRDVAEVRQIQLTLVDKTSNNLKLWIDASNFDKILINLLSNAMKYTHAGGHVEVEISQADANDKYPDGQFVMKVTDDGEGIPDDEKNRVFERFYQVRSTSVGKSGTGIGLHLTASLVRLHHGTIEVGDNANGQGTCFTVVLPLGHAHLKNDEMSNEPIVAMNMSHIEAQQVSPDAYVPELTPMADVPQSKKIVVVAEDDDEIRQYISSELSQYCHVVECRNGKEALDSILHQVPDLLLSDIMMPEIDGFELCRKIRSNVRLNHIPIVILSAKSDEESRIESLDCGADVLLTKPFSMEVLRRTIQNLLKSRATLRNTFRGQQMPVDQVAIPESKTPDERLMERIMKIVNQNLSNPNLTSDMIAAEVGLSRVHLYRKLKELTNQSARDFVRNIRLAKAAELLAQKKCSVSEVSVIVGFSHTSNFATSFKEVYGVTPSVYMGEHMKDKEEASQEESLESTTTD